MAHISFISPYDQYALGPRTLSTILKQRGHSISIIFLKTAAHNRNPENLIVPDGYQAEETCCSEKEYGLVRDILSGHKPDFIGISLASPSSGLAEWLTERLRSDFPDAPVVWGGADPTLNPELAVEHADYVFVGEAERTFPEFVERHLAGKDVCDIPGMWTEKDGTVIQNPPLLTQNLDEVPFPDFTLEDRYLVQNDVARPVPYHYYVIMTQRGCPCHCTFCFNSIARDIYNGGRYLRRRSVDNVIAELHAALKLHPSIDLIEFYDDVFTINKKWLREFADRYPKEIGIPFWCYTYPGMCDEEIADLLKQAGIGFAHMGIQSGARRTLNEVFKRLQSASAPETARILMSRDIVCRHDLIAGNPFEDEADHLETLEVLLDLPHPFRIDLVNPLVFFFKLPITRMAEEQGIPLRRVKGANIFYAEDMKNYPFWKSLYWLTQYQEIPKDTIRSMARSEYYRRNPDQLDALVQVMDRLVWHDPVHMISREEHARGLERVLVEKDQAIAAALDRLARIEGSPLYRLYQRAKPLWSWLRKE